MAKLLILRPQPGADETAARAKALGLEPVVAPLFEVRPLAWTAPAGPFDAVMLTSANAARHAGAGLAPFLGLPCFVVGEATAEAAQTAGFTDIRTGPADGAALVEELAAAGIAAALHLCGREHIPLAGAVRIADVPVYAAEAVGAFPVEARGALVLLHSPRAAVRFAELVSERSAIRIAAISAATAEAAGKGWASVSIAARPRDEALLELAAKLCQTEGDMRPTRA